MAKGLVVNIVSSPLGDLSLVKLFVKFSHIVLRYGDRSVEVKLTNGIGQCFTLVCNDLKRR